MVGFGGKHFVYIPPATGDAARKGVLSFAAIIFPWGLTWLPYAADYSLYMPSNTPKWKTFLWTFGGLYSSSTVGFLVGVAFASLLQNTNPEIGFPTVYVERGFGGLVGAVFEGHGSGVRGFGRFIQVIVSVTVVGANMPAFYSFALSVQAISTWTQRIPRVLVTLAGFSVALVLACVLRDRFVEALSNFMNVLGYWYAVVL